MMAFKVHVQAGGVRLSASSPESLFALRCRDSRSGACLFCRRFLLCSFRGRIISGCQTLPFCPLILKGRETTGRRQIAIVFPRSWGGKKSPNRILLQRFIGREVFPAIRGRPRRRGEQEETNNTGPEALDTL